MEKKNYPHRNPVAISIIIILTLVFSYQGHVTGIGSEDETSFPLSIDNIYWPMIGRDVYNTNEGSTSTRGLQDPDVKWEDTINSTSPGSLSAIMKDNIESQILLIRTWKFDIILHYSR
jgi:hypothetical protein